MTSGYDVVYTWFDHPKKAGHCISGYVIMPNHFHALIAFRNTEGRSINSIVGTGKRFMAYELVTRLRNQNDLDTLGQQAGWVNATDARKGKQHEVFEPSFDWKECYSDKFIEQKLDCIHDNPCRGEWNLAGSPVDYAHSSAKFYLTGEQGVYPITSYGKLKDIDLDESKMNKNRVAQSPRGGRLCRDGIGQ